MPKRKHSHLANLGHYGEKKVKRDENKDNVQVAPRDTATVERLGSQVATNASISVLADSQSGLVESNATPHPCLVSSVPHGGLPDNIGGSASDAVCVKANVPLTGPALCPTEICADSRDAGATPTYPVSASHVSRSRNARRVDLPVKGVDSGGGIGVDSSNAGNAESSTDVDAEDADDTRMP